MIPRANITAWRTAAPWPRTPRSNNILVLSRALVAMYKHRVVAEQAVIRGGTALDKLFFDTAGRSSEDIISCSARPDRSEGYRCHPRGARPLARPAEVEARQGALHALLPL